MDLVGDELITLLRIYEIRPPASACLKVTLRTVIRKKANDFQICIAYVHVLSVPSSKPCIHQAIYANRANRITPESVFRSRNVKQTLQLLDKRPFIIADIRPVKFLQGVYTLPTYQRVECVLFFPMSTVDRLVGSFDFNGDRGLAALYHGDLFVVALD